MQTNRPSALRVRNMLGIAALLCALATVAGAAERPTIGKKVGQMYPDFRLPKLGGGFARLSDFRGQRVLLLNFASW